MLPVTASDGIQDTDVTLLSYLMPPASPARGRADRVLPLGLTGSQHHAETGGRPLVRPGGGMRQLF